MVKPRRAQHVVRVLGDGSLQNRQYAESLCTSSQRLTSCRSLGAMDYMEANTMLDYAEIVPAMKIAAAMSTDQVNQIFLVNYIQKLQSNCEVVRLERPL